MGKLLIYEQNDLSRAIAALFQNPGNELQLERGDTDNDAVARLTDILKLICRRPTLRLREENTQGEIRVVSEKNIAPGDELYIHAVGESLQNEYGYRCRWFSE